MATANSNTGVNASRPTLKWPQEPEALLAFVPDNIEGSPYDMLLNVLTRANGVIALLCAEFMGGDDYRPKDQEIMGVLWIVQSQLQLAVRLMEKLDSDSA